MSIQKIIGLLHEKVKGAFSSEYYRPKGMDEEQLRKLRDFPEERFERIDDDIYVEIDEEIINNSNTAPLIIGKIIRKSKDRIKRQGTEAIAFYVPFHFDGGPLPWGIYFYKERLIGLALDVFKSNTFKTVDEFNKCFSSVKKMVLNHELFHHIVEMFATGVELTTLKPYYIDYSNKIYRKPTLSYAPVEEALANARSFIQFNKKKPDFGYVFDEPWLRAFMKNQPNGYRDYTRFEDKFKFANGRRFLETSIIEQRESPNPPLYPFLACIPTSNSGMRFRYNTDFSEVPKRFFPSSMKSPFDIFVCRRPKVKEILRKKDRFEGIGLKMEAGKGSEVKVVGSTGQVRIGTHTSEILTPGAFTALIRLIQSERKIDRSEAREMLVNLF